MCSGSLPLSLRSLRIALHLSCYAALLVLCNGNCDRIALYRAETYVYRTGTADEERRRGVVPDIMLGGSWQAEVAALENPTAEQIEKIKADWQVRHDAVLAAGGLHIIRY